MKSHLHFAGCAGLCCSQEEAICTRRTQSSRRAWWVVTRALVAARLRAALPESPRERFCSLLSVYRSLGELISNQIQFRGINCLLWNMFCAQWVECTVSRCQSRDACRGDFVCASLRRLHISCAQRMYSAHEEKTRDDTRIG